MTAITYRQLALSWHPDSDRDHTFNWIALVILAVALSVGLLMSAITVPKAEKVERVVVPERVARFIMERPKPKPVEPPKPVQLPKPEAAIERPKPVERKPLTQAEKKARKSAQSSGLLALANELSSLSDASSINTMVGTKINTAPTNTAAATVDTHILTSDTGRKSIGVHQEARVGTVGSTRLSDNQQQLAQGLLTANTEKAARSVVKNASQGGGASVRGDENVAVIMDQHKGLLYSIYNRARRTNPGLKGKIVLLLTILPSGQVSNIVIQSSDLHSPELEASLVARIKQFDFGKRDGGPRTVKVPVEFLPS